MEVKEEYTTRITIHVSFLDALGILFGSRVHLCTNVKIDADGVTKSESDVRVETFRERVRRIWFMVVGKAWCTYKRKEIGLVSPEPILCKRCGTFSTGAHKRPACDHAILAAVHDS